ncbi:integrin alpha-3-like isoform X1 [Seriola aureovittata]|uniref:integrin alpha-3-like isoform X1 n=2 Tax=Seriola aureovittata TaxID=2871759 RepID=UPI0024BEF721|nr:integrin alpha-3-like isoform X1 [Seriola aureovittata]XP_056258424.1 integrin alpha-3-like isoform X1 [Seriola aureovittata]
MASGVCVLLIVCVGVCVAFNLDTSFPLLKTGGDGSLFGLSVALHQDLKTDAYRLLVGAPREKAEPDVPANRTGGVYSCPITVDQSDCSRMKLIDPNVNLAEDLVEDMWLGVSVASQGRPGGRVLACGHRFVKLYGPLELRQMIGRCYLRGNDLQYDDNDSHWQNPEQPCSHLGDVRAEVMCNMGISASITQTEVIVGSPGSYEWQGNVHVSWMNPDDVFDTQKNSFTNMQSRNIYIGYSITQARRLLSELNETIVTGAPKDSKDDARGSVLLAVKQNNKLIVQQTLRGEQTGSYFGNAVATTDLNNDGWNDLLVGAPFYFHRQQEAGGAVYVYMNAGGRFDSRPSVVLRGPDRSGFGMAVTAAGDLNQDGFQDFAVGAPFHETGSVMIWTGSSGGVSTEPSQVIRGTSISPGFRTFGYSLSGGLDVDGNRYPDLVVGSLDDSVALLRTRPVIHLNKTLRVSPDVVDPNSCDFCIQVEVCFSYIFSTGERRDRDNITVHFTVTADITSLKSRLRFHANKQSIYSGYLSMPSKRCESLRVGLLSPIRDQVEPLVFSLNVSLYEKLPKKRGSMQDLKRLPVLSQTPRPFRTQIHIQKACGSDNRCHSNLQMAAQFTDEDQKPFTMQRGSQVLHYNTSVNRLFLEVNVSNTPSLGRPAEDAHNAILNISIPSSLIYSGVRTKGEATTTVGCSIENTVVLCELGNPFKSNQKVQMFIIFQLSDISLDTREIESLLQLSTLSEQSDLSPVSVSMLVEYSLQTSLTLISPSGPTSFSGHVIGESAMKKTEDVGSLLLFTFQVHISGKPLGRLGNLEVKFDWPRVVSNGKWLLYLTEIQMSGTSDPSCNPPGNIVNTLNLELSKEEKKRGRRSLEEEELMEEKQSENSLPVLHLQRQKKKSYTLDCLGGAECVTFVCPLINMNNSATLTLKARLWNSTMIEDYSDARTVVVRGRATLKLQTNKPTLNMEPHSTEIEVHIYPDLGQQLDSSAPLWIIVVSVLAGVSLLALICLLLWKCGFFVRRTAWRTAALHQGRIMGKHKQQHYTDSDGFLIQDHVPSSRNRKSQKHWVSSWTETH